jgi:hypothetical protein
MSEHTDEALRRQIVRRTIVLAFVGTGYCPGCHEQKEIFSRRQVTPGPTKERCLDCWRTER